MEVLSMPNVSVDCGPACFVAGLGDILAEVTSGYFYIWSIILGGLVLWTCVLIFRWIAGKSRRTFKR